MLTVNLMYHVSNVRMLHYFDFYTISKDQHSSLTIYLLIYIQGDLFLCMYFSGCYVCIYVISELSLTADLQF